MINKLQDICLCAIIKNEETNAAGGIRDYIESIVPYVGAAVIIDTGSTDGTREWLKNYYNEYPNLKIFDRDFRGFSDARNYSVFEGKKSNKKYALFLDADERLSHSDFKKLEYMMNKHGEGAYLFDFYQISFETGERDYSPIWNNRLVPFNANPTFKGRAHEILDVVDGQTFFSGIHIKHFLPSKNIRLQKLKWYENIKFYNMLDVGCPKHIRDFEEWKKTNASCG